MSAKHDQTHASRKEIDKKVDKTVLPPDTTDALKFIKKINKRRDWVWRLQDESGTELGANGGPY